MDARFAPLDHESLLTISGADTLTFLQGQSTCDTRELDTQRALPGLFCNPQGRALADFLLVQLDEESVLLRLRRAIAASTATTLGKYIAFSKATLEDADHDWRVFGLWGGDAADAAVEHFGATPGTRYGVTVGDGFHLVQLDEAGTAFECLLHGNGAQLNRLVSELPVGNTAEWDALHIASGVARLEAATAGEYIPQNLNYDLTGHISFTKGCYTGQEVVARLHYRGKSKRRVLLGNVSTEAPAPGSSLYAPDGTKVEGVVINAATPGDGDSSMLVCTSPDNLEQGLVLEGATATVSLALPPYPLAD